MSAATACRTCGIEPREGARYCDGCGAPIAKQNTRAEYKQVTVLFADVVRSMDLAAAVGTERLREIMADLADCCAAVVQRYGGTVDKFTGDGIMALFGAPVALEDHAIRACLAAIGIQAEVEQLAGRVRERDGVSLHMRVGLNSGQVIAGQIGSGVFGYTAIGEQVGMAQRMESAAAPGGVMLSASTARLAEHDVVLGEPEMVHIKGSDHPVPGRQLLSVPERDRRVARAESNLVGRLWEMSTIESSLERTIDGHGRVITVVGSPGIGKSRLVREVTALAVSRGVEVFTGYCQSHTSDIPFYAVARLLRAVSGVRGLEDAAARAQVRARAPGADPEDLMLFEDLLGIANPETPLPKIDPDARRRRLTAMVNTASLARKNPVVYVIEDSHWIDEVSESMLVDFLTVIPRAHALVLITYRPEYTGALSRMPGADSIALEPLSVSETKKLIADLLGFDTSVSALTQTIAEKAAGNPFFTEEIVRELSDRGVLRGRPGEYELAAEAGEVTVPATLQATIAARIDRLEPLAKRTLSAAAVVGSRFRRGLLETLGITPALDELLRGRLLDQITFTRDPDYVFHHPLIRTVAYESQLRSDRAELHRRLAAAIESRDPGGAEENAALIAEHLEAAGDSHDAYGWHMRAASWATNRDIAAARLSWERAQTIADALPLEDPNRTSMRIAPRTMLCGIAWRVHAQVAGDRFEELRQLCTAIGDQTSLAVGMAGLVMDHAFQARMREASQLASDAVALLESLGDPILTVGLSFPAIYAKAESGGFCDALRWSQRVIDLADGNASMGNFIFGSPLSLAFAQRGISRYWLGRPGWRDDLHRGLAMARSADPMSYAMVATFVYFSGIPLGVLAADRRAVAESQDALRIADRSGDDFAVAIGQMTLGLALVHGDPQRDRGQKLLAEVSEVFQRQGFALGELPLVKVYLARETARHGDRDEAISLMRAAVDHLVHKGQLLEWGIPATGVLVETLLDRRADGDVAEAAAAIERLAAAPAEDGLVMRDIWLLRMRALLALAHGEAETYIQLRDRYAEMAKVLGFEGHIAWSEAMS